jgi:hypothetical protein
VRRRSFISALVVAVASLAFLKAETAAGLLEGPADENELTISYAYEIGRGGFLDEPFVVTVNGEAMKYGEDFTVKDGTFTFNIPRDVRRVNANGAVSGRSGSSIKVTDSRGLAPLDQAEVSDSNRTRWVDARPRRSLEERYAGRYPTPKFGEKQA